MKTKLHSISFGILALVTLLHVAHAEDVPIRKERTFFGLTNEREFFKGALAARARPKKRFIQFTIGTPWSPYKGSPPLTFRLPDASLLDITSSNVVEVIKARGNTPYPSKESVYRRSDRKYHKWPEGSEIVPMPPYTFIINGDRLLGLSCYYSPDLKKRAIALPAVGRKGDKVYEAPLTLTDLITICGKPDKVIDSSSE